jgi:AcrR family transcriptional regulator
VPVKRDAQDPKARILAAALEVFGTKGYLGGSLREVATLSGYSRAGLLHHFPSKEAILLALLDDRDAKLDLPSKGEEGLGLFDLLTAGARRTPEILANRTLVQLAHALTAEASDPNHPAHDWVANRQAALREHFAKAIDRSKDMGELSPDVDSEALAVALLGMAEGVEGQWLVNPAVDVLKTHATLRAVLDSLRLK